MTHIAYGALLYMDAVKANIISIMNNQDAIRPSEFQSQLRRHVPSFIRTKVETTILDDLHLAQFGADDKFGMSIKHLYAHALDQVLITNPNIAGL